MSEDNKLDQLIGKSEVLIEAHEKELEKLDDEIIETEGWITITLKAIKNILLN